MRTSLTIAACLALTACLGGPDGRTYAPIGLHESIVDDAMRNAPRPNTSLGGRSASWTGQLDAEASAAENILVRGDMGLTIDLETLTGELEFTGLRRWEVGRYREHVAIDGFAYDVEVTGNVLKAVGSDDVEAQFYESNHERVLGTLDRDDMNGVFEGHRE